MNKILNRILAVSTSAVFLTVFLGVLPTDVDARGRDGAGMKAKAKTRTSIHRGGGNRANKAVKRGNLSGNRKNLKIDNSRRNINIDNSKNIDIKVNANGGRHGGYYGGGHGSDHHHPLATAAAIGVTAAVIGSIVSSLPPSCSTVVVDGVSYSQCGNTWYKPRYSGSNVTYVVVNPPH